MNIALIMIIIYGSLLLLSFALLGFWIWMLIDCLTKMESEGNEKLIWALIIACTNWIGALVYFFVQRPKNGLAIKSGQPLKKNEAAI